jgi:hypothetical protein
MSVMARSNIDFSRKSMFDLADVRGSVLVTLLSQYLIQVRLDDGFVIDHQYLTGLIYDTVRHLIYLGSRAHVLFHQGV